ncbi:exonuclease RNase T and DNA polymerase III [Dacryopinax primogenitus]|uniref:Exonuclease RNase T and DNA polymerase III n=1 Tax=Dacryopinax primogenitus (strain DJM 731) TaxID=1858805 RepID=M5G2H5_DACPD|nr:exonuclease RNase T and DNA polymerase III [Dacryopinax primogenitus]EJU04421.1 exonuclease RNase T and DNA polymerase III [Dacryopinax primogenitus]
MAPRTYHPPPPLKYFLILDFEATCASPRPVNFVQEVIEFPCIVYSMEQEYPTAMFHEYVKPLLSPHLTDFCTRLTGISQATVDSGDKFSNVWRRFNEWLARLCQDTDPRSFIFVTCGNWDLQTMLPAQLRQCGIEFPRRETGHTGVDFTRYVNIKDAFAEFYDSDPPSGLLEMLHVLGMQLEGRFHSGIDDCRNVSRIIEQMRRDGWKIEAD